MKENFENVYLKNQAFILFTCLGKSQNVLYSRYDQLGKLVGQ